MKDNDEYGLLGKIDSNLDLIDDVSTKTLEVSDNLQDDVFEPILKKDCTIKDVTKVIIDQINGIQHDIISLEQLRRSLKSIFPTEQDSYRNAYIIENKIKTFTGFYTTILSYKKELNSMLFKLREMLKTGGSVEEFKQALKEVLGERSRIQNKTEENKQKIDEILKDKPNLLPKSL